MQCQHTGIQIYLEEYGLFIRGDYFVQDEVHIFRLNTNSICYKDPSKDIPTIYNTLHGVVTESDAWWDEMRREQTSTLVAGKGHFKYFGYEGKPISEVLIA